MYQIEEPKYFYLFIAVAILLLFYLLTWLFKNDICAVSLIIYDPSHGEP